MTSSMSHCLILLMKPIWNLEKSKQEPSELEDTKNEFLGSVNLKLLHLKGVDSTELISVKSTLRKSANHFKNVTGSDRQFLVGVKEVNDVAHSGHVCIELGVGLI